MNKTVWLLFVIALVALLPSVAMASDITDATYSADIVVTNAGASTASNVSTVFTLKSQNLIDGLYADSTLTNTAVISALSEDVAYMPAAVAGDQWVVFISGISGNASQTHKLYTGGGDMDAKLAYFPAAGGMTTAYSASFIMGNNFEIEQRGWLNADAVGGVLAYLNKTGPSVTYSAIITTGTISISLDGVPTLSLAALTTGERVIKYGASGGSYYLKVYDASTGTLIDETTVVNAFSVNNNYNNAACNTFVTDSAMTWLQYQKVTISGTLQQHIVWQNAATFDDLSAGNHDAVPSFRTTTSNADVTAELRNFSPINKSSLGSYTAADDVNWIGTAPTVPTGMYAEGTYTRLPGADIVNTILDAGGIPYMLFWLPALFATAIIALFGVFWLTRSMLVGCVVSIALLLFYGILGVIPVWVGIALAVIAIAIVVKRETSSL